MDPRNPTWEADTRATLEVQNFVRWLGIQVEHIAPGELVLSMAPRAEFMQQDGTLHAGVITTIADVAAGLACFTLFEHGQRVVSSEIKLNFLRPALGERIIARGICKRSGRRLAVGAADVFAVQAGREVLVATALGTMVPWRPEERG